MKLFLPSLSFEYPSHDFLFFNKERSYNPTPYTSTTFSS